MKEFTTAVKEVQADDEEEKFVEFTLDGRTLRAYHPIDGQLAYMMVAMGRGQTTEQRFAAIINVMLACLRDDDRDYMDARLLSRGADRLPVTQVEAIFEHLIEEWFARPTQPSSDSAASPPSDGEN